MRIGRLDRKITIQRKQTVRDESTGEELEEWTDLYPSIWAEKRVKSGREAIRSEQLVASNIVVWKTHYKEVKASDRVLEGEQIYAIISPPNEIGRRQGLELICEAKDNG